MSEKGYTEREERMARYAKAMGHPARMAILHFLASQQSCFFGDLHEVLPIAKATVSQHLKELKEAGVWVFGTAANGTTPLYQADLKGPAAIVIGSEGAGMGRLVAEKCDFKVRIPMKGRLNSLNASAAAAIMLYEAVRQRMQL